jgi:hypothetical protein
MKDPEDTTRRLIEMPEHEITTHVEYSLIEGRYVVVLNPDADYLPSRVKLYLPRETSQALVRDLTAQQAEADRRNHAEDPERPCPGPHAEAVPGQVWCGSEPGGPLPASHLADRAEPVEWAGRTFGQLTADEKARATRQAAGQLQDELQAAAPAIAKVLAEAEPRTILSSQLGSGCPQCGTDLWGFASSSDEDAGLGPASCERGHAWTVTEG